MLHGLHLRTLCFYGGMSKEQTDKFSDMIDSKGTIEDVLDALKEVVDWEDE